MTHEAEAIDWSAPIEAYHPDGRVVEVKRLRDGPVWPDSEGHYHVDGDGVPLFFDEEGVCHHGGSWRIRNRKPAQQWGDPIETVVDDLPMMRATIRALREGMGE